MLLLISKETKIPGKRQTWAVFKPRPNVSATVWEPIAGLTGFRSVYDAKLAASRRLSVSYTQWVRETESGSANYRAQIAG